MHAIAIAIAANSVSYLCLFGKALKGYSNIFEYIDEGQSQSNPNFASSLLQKEWESLILQG